MKKPKTGGMRIEPQAAPMTLRPEKRMDTKAKAPAKDAAPMKDMAYERNFTRKGTPRLSASSGEGAMGQRR